MLDDPAAGSSGGPSAGPSPGPLAGLLVADLSTVLAGPMCTMLLGDLGADIVKVEPPGGDPTRGWGPPWVGSEADGTRTATYFLAVNRNKRSLRLDLAQHDGRRVLNRLLERADVLVDNLRVGALERMGFGEGDLRALNDSLVHVAISGYGPTGPDAERPGYDFVLQAEAGLMSITGFPDAEAGRPTKVGVAIADVVTGLFATIGVLAGLLDRGAPDPGGARRQGQRVDVSILESTLAVLVNQAHNAFAMGRGPVRLGNAHPNIVPYETFATSDGEIAVAVGSDAQWRRLCTALELQIADDARFATNAARVEHRGELRPILASRFGAQPADAWLAALRAAEIPSGPINDVASAFRMPQAEARRMRVSVEHPTLGPLDQVGVPIELSATPATIRLPPPLLGEHADDILDELGFSPVEVESMRRLGVV